MGNIIFGPPKEAIDFIQRSFVIQTFVETGTYQGDTAAWAADHFLNVFTIEGSPEFREAAQKKYRRRSNISFLQGDSRSVLPKVVAELTGPALFWLDAHWMPGAFGASAECPVLEEIAVINQTPYEHFILIDDARYFLAPPPRPHLASNWPDIAAILAALAAGQPDRFRVIVYNDVLVCIPRSAFEECQKFYQDQATTALERQAIPNGNPQRVGWPKRILRRCFNVSKRLLTR